MREHRRSSGSIPFLALRARRAPGRSLPCWRTFSASCQMKRQTFSKNWLCTHPSYLHSSTIPPCPSIALFQEHHLGSPLKRFGNRWKFYAGATSNIQRGNRHFIALPFFFFATQYRGLHMLQRKRWTGITLPVGRDIFMPHHILEVEVSEKAWCVRRLAFTSSSTALEVVPPAFGYILALATRLCPSQTGPHSLWCRSRSRSKRQERRTAMESGLNAVPLI